MEVDSENRNAGGRRTSLGEKMKNMSLEAYIDFFDSHKSLHLTVNFLNQIIHMHGFRKLYGLPKKVLTDTVNTLDLVDPSRSTLTEKSISSAVTLTLEDVIADLEILKWQECCVTSLQILNLQKDTPPFPSAATAATQIAPDPESPALAVAKPTETSCKTKKPRKKKKKMLDCFDREGSGSCEATKNPSTPNKKKKKKRHEAAVATGGDGVDGGLGI